MVKYASIIKKIMFYAAIPGTILNVLAIVLHFVFSEQKKDTVMAIVVAFMFLLGMFCTLISMITGAIIDIFIRVFDILCAFAELEMICILYYFAYIIILVLINCFAMLILPIIPARMNLKRNY